MAALRRPGPTSWSTSCPWARRRRRPSTWSAPWPPASGVVNCIPVFIASDLTWEKRFRDAKLPIVGDDVKAQLGATIVHRALTNLFRQRGVDMKRTYQLNTGGNTDFLNMTDRNRLKSKKTSKTESVQSQMEERLSDENIHVGPSDYVPWLNDNKLCFLRLEGDLFGGVPMNIEVRLSVEDSPNSAGVVVDAIRCCKLALDRGEGGVVVGPRPISASIRRTSSPTTTPSAWSRSSSPEPLEDRRRVKAAGARQRPSRSRRLPVTDRLAMRSHAGWGGAGTGRDSRGRGHEPAVQAQVPRRPAPRDAAWAGASASPARRLSAAGDDPADGGAFGVVLIALMLDRTPELFNLLVASCPPGFGMIVRMMGNLVPHYLGLALAGGLFHQCLPGHRADERHQRGRRPPGRAASPSARLTWPFVAVGAVIAAISVLLLGYIQPYGRYGYNGRAWPRRWPRAGTRACRARPSSAA